MFDQESFELGLAGFQTMASSFAQIAGSSVNYQLLKTQSRGYETQALSVETQAEERANRLREELNRQFGSIVYGAAASGIRASSPMVLGKMELSAKNMGLDNQSMRQDAQAQASALRSNAKIMRIRRKADHFGNIMGQIPDLIDGSMILKKAFTKGDKK